MILSPYLSYGIETESVVFENSEQSGKDRRDDILSASLPLWNQILTEQEKGIFFYVFLIFSCSLFYIFHQSNSLLVDLNFRRVNRSENNGGDLKII